MPDTNQSYGSIDSVNLSSKNNNSKHGYRMVIITIVVVLIAIGGLVVSKRENLQQILKGQNIQGVRQDGPTSKEVEKGAIQLPASTIKDRQVPWLEVLASDASSMNVGDTKVLTIRGTSGNHDITGYDMLIAYDPTMLEIQSATSMMPDYEIFKFDRGDHMTITGIKNFKQRQPIMFTGGDIVQLVVKAKKSGKATVTLNPKMGQEKTQMVDANVQVIEPQIGSIQLDIQ